MFQWSFFHSRVDGNGSINNLKNISQNGKDFGKFFKFSSKRIGRRQTGWWGLHYTIYLGISSRFQDAIKWLFATSRTFAAEWSISLEFELKFVISIAKWMKNIYLQTFLRLFAELLQTPGLISGLDVAAPSVDGSNSTMPFIFPFPTKNFKFKTKTKWRKYIKISFTTKLIELNSIVV